MSIMLTMTSYMSKCQEFESEHRLLEECNRTITENAGIIVSTNFSTNYPPNHRCSWTVVVDEGSIVRLEFWAFEVERGTYCHNDKLSVYDGPSPEYPLLGRFCGPFRPAAQVSTSNKIHLQFVTDSTNQNRGFYAQFSAEKPVIATEGSCGGLLNSPTGSFQSPRYQVGNYPSSVSCSWHIQVPGSRNIRLTFKDFDLEKSLGCKYDALVLESRGIDSEENRVVERYCGQRNAIPEQITYSGEELFVTFISDASGFGRGFVANYESDDGNEQIGEYTTSTTNITSPSESTALVGLPQSTPGSTLCPRRCTKVRPKSRICSANYMAAVRIPRTDGLLGGNRVTVDVIDTFKSADASQPASIQLQLLCPNCHKVKRPAVYLVLGDLENGILTLQHTDYIVKYKSKKHPKVIPKWIKNCDRRRRRRRRKRGGHKRSSNN